MRPGAVPSGASRPSLRARRSAIAAAATCSQASSRLPQSHSKAPSAGVRITVRESSPPRNETCSAISPSRSGSAWTAPARACSTPRDQAEAGHAARIASRSASCGSAIALLGLAQRVLDLAAELLREREGRRPAALAHAREGGVVAAEGGQAEAPVAALERVEHEDLAPAPAPRRERAAGDE